MSINREYGKLISADTAIEYAPTVLTDVHGTITRPAQADYLKFGWKREFLSFQSSQSSIKMLSSVDMHKMMCRSQCCTS